MKANRRFGGTGSHHLQDKIISPRKTSMKQVASRERSCYLLRTGFLLGLFFDPEDGVDMFLLNVT
jgi:hypothetical protein